MNKDYKIGIVVGLVVLALGVVYYTVTNKPEQPASPVEVPAEADNQPELGTTAPPADTIIVPVEVPAPVEVVIPKVRETVSETAVVKLEDTWELPSSSRKAEPANDEEVAPIKFASNKTAPANTGAGETGYASADEGSDDTTGEYFKLDDGASITADRRDPEIVRSDAADKPVPVAYRGKDTYVVQTGDDLWTIAERVYGPGKGLNYKLIVKANPEIDPNALRVGKKLRIPPLPSASVRAVTPRSTDTTRTPRADRRGIVVNAKKQQIYTVTGADAAGYWGIAKKVYGPGNASKYLLIQKANPKVNPQKLRAGMKLVIPPLPKPAARSTESIYRSGTARGTTTTITGGKTYTVKKGDSLWAIAEKIYGNGTYSNIIVNANPKMDPENLKLGQKIILPPKPKKTSTPIRIRSRRRRTSTPAPSPARPGEPDFGP